MRFQASGTAVSILVLVVFLAVSSGVVASEDSISVVGEWHLDDILEDFWAVAPDGSEAFWSIDDDTVRKHELSNPKNILDSGNIPDDGNQEGLAKDGGSFWVVGHDEVWKEEIGASSPSKTYQPECEDPQIYANGFAEIKRKDGYLWIVRGSTETGIMKVDPDTGSCVEGWTFQLDDNREASGLAWDPDRNVWWLGVRANRIYKLDGGDPSNVLASYTVDGIENADGLAYINDYLYVADHDDSWFYKLELPAQEPDQSPTAHLTADPKQGPAPHEVTFALDADPGDNSVDSWELYYGDGDSTWGNGDPNDLQKTHTYQDPGSYDARLTVTDTAGKQDNATVTISVGEPDDAGNSQSTAKELSMGEEYEAEVGGSDSRDVFKAHVQKDHEIRITVDHLSDVDMDWEVEKPDGGVAMQEASGTGTETYDFIPESTAYTYVEVWPKDSSQTGQFSILFEDLGGESNDPPSASVSASPTSGDAPLDVTFEVSASDSDGFVDWWKIETDDGGMVEGEGGDTSAEYTYDEPGTYTAELTVHDDRGAQSEDRVTIQVGESDGSGSEEGSDDGTTGDSDAEDGSEGNRSAEIVGVDGVPDEYTEEPFEVQVRVRNTGDVEAKFRVTARERTGIQIGSTYGDGDDTRAVRLSPNEDSYVVFTVELYGTPGKRVLRFDLSHVDEGIMDQRQIILNREKTKTACMPASNLEVKPIVISTNQELHPRKFWTEVTNEGQSPIRNLKGGPLPLSTDGPLSVTSGLTSYGELSPGDKSRGSSYFELSGTSSEPRIDLAAEFDWYQSDVGCSAVIDFSIANPFGQTGETFEDLVHEIISDSVVSAFEKHGLKVPSVPLWWLLEQTDAGLYTDSFVVFVTDENGAPLDGVEVRDALYDQWPSALVPPQGRDSTQDGLVHWTNADNPLPSEVKIINHYKDDAPPVYVHLTDYLERNSDVPVITVVFPSDGAVKWMAPPGITLSTHKSTSALSLSTQSEVKMTVTAPSGAMTGFDDENTEVTREIPQSSYNISSDFGQFLTLQRPSPGMYEITLSGDSDSPYSVKVMNSGTDGTESTESLSGAISSAKPDRYGFEVSPNGEIELTAGPFNIPTVRYVTTILTILTGVFLVYWKDHV